MVAQALHPKLEPAQPKQDSWLALESVGRFQATVPCASVAGQRGIRPGLVAGQAFRSERTAVGTRDD